MQEILMTLTNNIGAISIVACKSNQMSTTKIINFEQT